MVYLFLGDDALSKDTHLLQLKQHYLSKDSLDFNFETLYARDINLNNLQEKMLCLPVNSPKRVIVIKNAQDLKDEVADFLLEYCKKPFKHLELVLDARFSDKKNKKGKDFITKVLPLTKLISFKQNRSPSAFDLSRLINMRKADQALLVLNDLLNAGQKPEMVIGALRHVWERENLPLKESRRRLKLLLECDSEVKSSRLKADFALEKLVVELMRRG